MFRGLWFFGLVALLVAVAPAPARALTIDFSTVLPAPGGNWGSSTYSNGPVTADAYYWNGTTYTSADTTLFVRNEAPNDLGFGVCSPGESSTACAPHGFAGGGGNDNELSNEVHPELIRLTLAPGYSWVDAWISSLDTAEKGQLWASNLSGTLGQFSAGEFTSFAAGGPVTFSFPITGDAATSNYLYFIPGPTGTNNGYLVYKVDVVANPEPGTLLLLGSGLATFGALAWRRARAVASTS